jgi:hypothetical protein
MIRSINTKIILFSLFCTLLVLFSSTSVFAVVAPIEPSPSNQVYKLVNPGDSGYGDTIFLYGPGEERVGIIGVDVSSGAKRVFEYTASTKGLVGAGNWYRTDDPEPDCLDEIDDKGDKSDPLANGTLIVRKPRDGGARGCTTAEYQIRLQTASAKEIQVRDETFATVTAAAEGSEEQQQTCDTALGSFSWLVCPMARELAGWVDTIETVIQDLLRMNEVSQDNGIYQSWAALRTVAVSLLVLVALVAIASQIFGFEFISAYTMKKLIPKLVIAAILLQLSFFLAATAIQFFNALGDGAEALIMAPFGSGETVKISDDQIYNSLAEANSDGQALNYILGQFEGANNNTAFATAGFFLTASVVGFASFGGIAGLFFVVLIVAAAIAVAFITLVLRKVVILALIVVLPLAIVAWILPSTSKFFDKWWDLFSKLLLMYPLVIGLLAVGKVAAYIMSSGGTSSVSSGGSILTQFAAVESSVLFIMIIIAYFGPFFFIPSMFKIAGGAFAKAISTMDNLGKKGAKAATDKGPLKNIGESYTKRKKDKAVGLATQDVGKNPIKYMRRAKARNTIGTLGSWGALAETQRRQERENLQKSNNEVFQAEFSRLSGSERKEYLAALHNADIGDDFEVGGKKYKATAAKKLGGLEQGLNYKLGDEVETSIAKLEQAGAGTKDQLNYATDNPIFDDRLPYYTRAPQVKDPSGNVVRKLTTAESRQAVRTPSAALPVAGGTADSMAVFDKMVKSSYYKAGGGVQDDIREGIAYLSRTGSGTEHLAASALTTLATDKEATPADLEKLRAKIGAAKIDTDTLLKVSSSDGGLRIEWDSSLGKYVAKSSSSA